MSNRCCDFAKKKVSSIGGHYDEPNRTGCASFPINRSLVTLTNTFEAEYKTAFITILRIFREPQKAESIANEYLTAIVDGYKKIPYTPFEVGDKVAVRALCECVCTTPDNDECRYICPFEDDCECDECDNANERIFLTTISGIFNDGTGWKVTFKNMNIEASIKDLGISFFCGENAEQQAKEYEKKIKGL